MRSRFSTVILFWLLTVLFMQPIITLQGAQEAGNQEMSIWITGFTAVTSLHNFSLTIIVGSEQRTQTFQLDAGDLLETRADFELDPASDQVPWLITATVEIDGSPVQLLNVEGQIDLVDKSGEYRRTFYDKERLSFDPKGLAAIRFELTDIKAICTLTITFKQEQNITYEAFFVLGSTVTNSTDMFMGRTLELNSSEVRSLQSSTPFTLIVDRTDRPEQLVLVNGSLSFSPRDISIPTPTQRLSSRILWVEYKFVQTQFGYDIALNNNELLHAETASTKVIGAEKTISVTVRTDGVEPSAVTDLGGNGGGRSIGKGLLESAAAGLGETVETVAGSWPLLLAGVLFLSVAAWLVRNKRRTDRWVSRPEIVIDAVGEA